jgi:hypothetical protein
MSVILKIQSCSKIQSKLETRGCVAGENAWECITQKLLIVTMMADCQAGCCCYNKSKIFQGSHTEPKKNQQANKTIKQTHWQKIQ